MPAAVVLYDGRCRFCVAGAKRLAALARPGAIELADFQAPGVLARFPQLTHDACMRAMQMIAADGRVYAGAEAVARALATRGWLGLWRLYYVPGLRWMADALYEWVAAHRYWFMGRADDCEDGACALHDKPAAPTPVDR